MTRRRQSEHWPCTDIDGERRLLGQVLAYPDRVLAPVRRAGVDGETFARAAHQTIWRTVSAEAAAGRVVDLPSIVAALRRADALDDVGGPAYVAALADGHPRWTQAAADQHARELVQLARHRALSARVRALAEAIDASDGRQADAIRAQLTAALEAFEAGDGSPARAARVVRLDTVRPERIQWLWPGRLAAGKLHLLAGDPGLGKSTVTLDVAARLSRGATWPDGASGGAPCDVLLLQAEDGLADTVRPRLDQLGADVARVHAITGVVAPESDGWIALDRDLAAIRGVAERTRAAALVVDPLTAYLGPDVDSYRDADVRRLLGPLAAMAADLSLAIVAVMHLRKGGEARALARIGGSVGFGAAARLVLAVAADPDDEDRRLLLPVKANITAPAATLAFRLVDGGLVWEPGTVDGISADALLNARPDLDRGEVTDAEAVLVELLTDESAWPLDARDALAAGRQHGIAERTLRRAARRVGIEIRRAGFGRGGRWLWHRPVIGAIPAIPACAVEPSPMAAMRPLCEDEDAYTVPR